MSARRAFTRTRQRRERGFESFWRSAQQGFGSFRRSAQQGFTLIEMMVALAVFSLAALALIRLEGASFRGAATLDRVTMANIVARNVAVDALTDAKPPAIGTAQGVEINAGKPWRWVRVTSALGGGRVLGIEINVADPTGTSSGRVMVIRELGPQKASAQ